jgi:hypothetical protein
MGSSSTNGTARIPRIVAPQLTRMLSLRCPQGDVRRKFHYHSVTGVSRLQIAGAYPKTKQRKAEGWPGAGRKSGATKPATTS